MTENMQQDEQEKQLRQKLLKRLAIAGAMVLVLLGVLAFFDYLSSRREETPVKVFTKPVPVPPKKEVTQPVTPAPSSTALVESTTTTQTTTSSSAPEAKPHTEAPKETAPSASVPAKVSVAPEKTPPTVVKPAQVLATKPPARATVPVPEASAAPSTETVKPTPPVQAPSESPTAAPTTRAPQTVLVPPASSLPRLFTGYAVQAGVFSNARAAEEMHAKLALNGIPSTMEARIQVGPFKSRAEAEAAREKLKALGIDGLLIPPAGRR